MASGPYFDPRRGTYSIQWFDGAKWTRATVHKIPGWKPGKPEPKRTPPEALAALVVYRDKEAAARRNRPLDPGRTVAEFLGAYQAVYARDRTEGSAGELAKAVKLFLAWCQTAKISLMDQIEPSVCQKFIDARAAMISQKTGRPITAKRMNQERAMLSGAWVRALKLREVRENPWTPVSIPGWDKQRRARVHKPSWSPEEFARLLAVSAPWLRDLLTLGTQTGLRISALTALEWRDIRWPKTDRGFGEVDVRSDLDKTGKGYRVPISRTCHDMLMRRKMHRDAHETHVLTGAQGRPTRTSTSATAIIRACKRAGLVEPASPNHHMRRSFGRWAVLGHLTGRPVPLYVVSRWLGHSDVKTTQIYLDIRDDESQAWMEDYRPEGQPDGESSPPSSATPPPASGAS